MALDIQNLTNYVDEQRVSLIRKMVLGGRSINYMTIVPDVKSSVTLNTITTDLALQAGSCGYSDTTDTILNQNTLTVCPIKMNSSVCISDVEQVYLQYLVSPGSYAENFGFEQIYAEDKVANISSAIDTLLWQGDVNSGNPQLALCDGLIKYATTSFSGDVVNGNVSSATAITASNIVQLIDDMVHSTPTNIIDRDDLYLFVGFDVYRTYALALRNLNLFAYTGAENQGEQFSQKVPGTNVTILGIKGLVNTNKMFLTAKANLAYGCDLVNDYEDMQIFWSNDNQEVRSVAKFKMGVQANFWDYVVYFELV